MYLPECYQLRADYSFSLDEMSNIDDSLEIDEILAGIATDSFSVIQITSGNKKDTCNSQPIISIHINRDANLIQLSAYSCSVRREVLFDEAIMMQSILRTVFANKTGTLIDHLSQSRKRLRDKVLIANL